MSTFKTNPEYQWANNGRRCASQFICILAASISLMIAMPLCIGCSQFKSEKTNKKTLSSVLNESSPDQHDEKIKSKSQGKKVRWDGGGVILGESDNLAYTTVTFRETIQNMIGGQRFTSAKNLVSRTPDIALETLQNADPATQEDETLTFIAQCFDELWCTSGTRHWQNYVNQLRRGSKVTTQIVEKRQQFWQHLKQHQPQQALQLDIVKSLDKSASPMLVSDCYRLEAIAMMMSAQHADSIIQLSKAINIIGQICPIQRAKLELLLGEFYRHAGQLDRWKKTWQNAVATAAGQVKQNQLTDPTFWSRAAFLRPADTPWPVKVIENLQQPLRRAHLNFPPSNSPNGQNESIIWATVGLQSLRRAEGQNAILAFKKAEAITTDAKIKPHLQLFQAQSMIHAGQPGPASVILIRLISESEGSLLADRAKAILGAMKLQNGGIEQGMNLIESAVKSVDQWPQHERLRAQADYALALLVRGREREGIELLTKIRNEFQNARLYDQASQCLWNMAKYYEVTEKPDQHRTALAMLNDFEKKGF